MNHLQASLVLTKWRFGSYCRLFLFMSGYRISWSVVSYVITRLKIFAHYYALPDNKASTYIILLIRVHIMLTLIFLCLFRKSINHNFVIYLIKRASFLMKRQRCVVRITLSYKSFAMRHNISVNMVLILFLRG